MRHRSMHAQQEVASLCYLNPTTLFNHPDFLQLFTSMVSKCMPFSKALFYVIRSSFNN